MFKSDFILLKRVIGNMVKNALEETDKGSAITIGCRKLEKEAKHLIEFWVNNIKYMEKDVQNQVFKRAFSTKGTGRGLGTYSMKLLGEKYLKGSVGFTSDKHKGTTFYIRLPLDE